MNSHINQPAKRMFRAIVGIGLFTYVLYLPALALHNRREAALLPPLAISLASEYNGNYGYFEPGKAMSFTAVVNDPLIPPPSIVTSGTVGFSLEAVPGYPKTLSLSTNQASINGCGQ